MNPRPLKLPSYELKYLTWKDVEKYLSSNNRIIVPIGSTEQHGPKSILGTDHLAAENIAIELAKRSKVLVAPALSIGMSEHHLAFPGTLSFPGEVYYLVIYNLLFKLAKHGFKRILIINGHGGNCHTVKTVFYQLSEESKDLSFALVNWWDIPSVKAYLDIHFGKWEGKHATPGETSLMMYFYPEKICNNPVPKGKRPSKEKYNNCSKPEDYRKLFPDGIWYADPNLARKDHGKAILTLSLDYLVPKLTNWSF
jgi:creatinine amidohydrolase